MTATMTARWNSVAEETGSPDVQDPRSSITSPPGHGTDGTAFTGKEICFFCVCLQANMVLAARVLNHFFSSPSISVFFDHPSVSGTVPSGENQECFLNF